MSDIKLISTSTTLQEQFGGTLVMRAQPAGTSYGPQTDSQPAPELLSLIHISGPRDTR